MKISGIHQEILRILRQRDSTYARPVSSGEIGAALNVSPSYVREVIAHLQGLGLVRVRRGRGGGYYLGYRYPSNGNAPRGSRWE